MPSKNVWEGVVALVHTSVRLQAQQVWCNAMCFYHQDQIYSESLMQCVCACYQDQNYSYFRLFRMKWSILILVAMMPCLQALCFMNVSFSQMIFLWQVMSLSLYLFLLSSKIPQILCSQICYWPIYVHILIFYWIIFRDICICWIPIIHTSKCLFKEMFTLLVWSGGEAWKAERLCGDLWPELLQGFYFLTIS